MTRKNLKKGSEPIPEMSDALNILQITKTVPTVTQMQWHIPRIEAPLNRRLVHISRDMLGIDQFIV